MSDCLSSDPAPIFTAGQLLNLFEAQFPPGTKALPSQRREMGQRGHGKHAAPQYFTGTKHTRNTSY